MTWRGLGKRPGAIIMAAALGACGSGSGAGSGTPDVAVPAFVQRMVDVNFPADGQIHVQSVGKFEIKPSAAVCHIKSEIDPALKQGAPGFYGPGIDGHENGQLNVGLRNGTPCADNGSNLIAHWQLINNRNGKPYKLILAVWQGHAAWVGVVERLGGSLHPDAFLPGDDVPESTTPSQETIERRKAEGQRILSGYSADMDSSDLSKMFVGQFASGDK